MHRLDDDASLLVLCNDLTLLFAGLAAADRHRNQCNRDCGGDYHEGGARVENQHRDRKQQRHRCIEHRAENAVRRDVAQERKRGEALQLFAESLAAQQRERERKQTLEERSSEHQIDPRLEVQHEPGAAESDDGAKHRDGGKTDGQ